MTPFTPLGHHMDHGPNLRDKGAGRKTPQLRIPFQSAANISANLTTTNFSATFQSSKLEDVSSVDQRVCTPLPCSNGPVAVRYILVQEQCTDSHAPAHATHISQAPNRPSTLGPLKQFQAANEAINDKGVGDANAKLEIAIPQGPLQLPTAATADIGGLSPGSVEITTSTFYSDENVSQILDFLFLGTIEAAYNEPLLCRLRISRLVDLSNLRPGEVPSSKKTSCPCTCSSATSHLRARLCVAVADSDTEDLTPYLDDINKFIECSRRSSWRVLVFCFNGDSRSAAAIVQYLMLCRKMSLHQAFSLVRKHRESVAINRGFFRMLQGLDKYRGRMGFAAGDYNTVHRPSTAGPQIQRPFFSSSRPNNSW